jgi:hypothetical protein
VIELVFGFFAIGWVPWALSGLIVLAAALIWLDFRYRRLAPVLAGLDDAIAAVGEAAGPGAFRARFTQIYRRLADNKVIGEGWRAYAPTLAPSPSSDEAMGYSRRPSENFNEGLLASAGVNLRFYHAVPNHLVGVGLFFTFCGLVAALYFASGGVAAADVQQAQGALRDLLAAATFKFVTSIAGLGASIVFSSAEKRQLYRVQRRLDRFCAMLEERMVPVTPESLAATQLKELKIQSGHLRRIGRNIFVTVPEALEDRLAEELVQAMEPMREALAEAAERLRRIDQVVAERMMGGEFAWSGEAAAQPVVPVPRPLPPPAAAAEPPPAMPATLPSGAAMETLISETQAMRAALEQLASILPAGLPAARRPENAAELQATLQGFVELFENAAHGLEVVDRQFGDTLVGMTEALEGLSDRIGRGEGDQRAAGLLAAGLVSFAESRRELDQLGRAFREVASESRATLEAGAGAEHLDAGLVASLERLGQGVQGFNLRMRGFVRRMEERLARAGRLVDSLAGELEGAHGPDQRRGR